MGDTDGVGWQRKMRQTEKGTELKKLKKVIKRTRKAWVTKMVEVDDRGK